MGFADDVQNNAKEALGNAKEWIGDKTDNESLQAEGVKDKAAAAAEGLKDKAADAIDDIRPH